MSRKLRTFLMLGAISAVLLVASCTVFRTLKKSGPVSDGVNFFCLQDGRKPVLGQK